MAGREITAASSEADRTIATGDIGDILEANNNTTNDLEILIPIDIFSDFDEVKILRSNSGPVVIMPTTTGITINGVSESPKFFIPNRYGLASLIRIAANTWSISGDIVDITESGGGSNLDFPVPVMPKLSDLANIEKAFNLYHYGIDTGITSETTLEELGEGSVAKYLAELNAKVNAAELGEVIAQPIGNTNLNSITQTGFYYSPSSPSGNNYPVNSVPGNLYVIANGTSGDTFGVTQLYQSYNSNRVWIRSTTSYQGVQTWVSWKELTDFYTKSEIDARNLHQLPDITIATTASSVSPALAAGQVLQWVGGTVNQWTNQLPVGASGASFADRIVYTAGNYTWTKPTNPAIKLVRIYGVGGGGGGGGVKGTNTALGSNNAALAGGGGAGAYFDILIPSAQLASINTLAISVGSGGSGGSTAPGDGSSGGATTIKINNNTASIVSAGGGSGGKQQENSGFAAPGDGGTTTFGGTPYSTNGIAIPGGAGGRGVIAISTSPFPAGDNIYVAYQAPGGTSYLSSSRYPSTSANGVSGATFGGGGNGARSTGQNSYTGGSGAGGVVILETYV